MLDRMRGIRHPCDLDLLLFFYRHPCALLSAEQLVADPRPVLRMSWERESLQVEARVAPLGLDAVWLRPGVGNPARPLREE